MAGPRKARRDRPLGCLKDRAVVLDLKDYERALVWVDGRFSHILPPGLYAYWTTFREVAVEVIDARKVRFEHKDLQVIVRSAMANRLLDAFAVEQGHVGVLFEDGRYVETLPPGKYAFWKNMAKVMHLMNKVTEAKAAEANLIVRREETAAMRSQANTAKVLEGNPTQMRLRELEVLERVATSGKLNVVLGEKGLAERVVNLL